LIDPARGSIGDTRLPPTLIVNGWHVATVQFSRAVREGVACATQARGPASGRGLSKLNSMHPVPAPIIGCRPGARFGRRARPYGRKLGLVTVRVPKEADGPASAVPYGHQFGAP
jgi:hypothetical protein